MRFKTGDEVIPVQIQDTCLDMSECLNKICTIANVYHSDNLCVYTLKEDWHGFMWMEDWLISPADEASINITEEDYMSLWWKEDNNERKR